MYVVIVDRIFHFHACFFTLWCTSCLAEGPSTNDDDNVLGLSCQNQFDLLLD